MNIKDLEIIKSFQSNKRKTTFIIAGSVIAIILIIVIVRKYKNIVSAIKDRKRENELIEEANKNMIGEDITLTEEEFGNLAQRLYKAMKGIGTDEDAIWEIYGRLNTRSDVLKLNKTFGIIDGESLLEWLHGDLTQEEMIHLNQILANKGINYQY